MIRTQSYPIAAELLPPGNVVALTPRSFLGGELFTVYRAATSNTCRYDPKNKRQICPISRFAEAKQDLSRAGFTVVPNKALDSALAAEASERQRDRDALEEILSNVGARMAKATGGAGLFPYQSEGVRFLSARTRALLADEPGLGKTVQTLGALPPDARAIIVCPAVARGVWSGAIKTLRPDLRSILVSGSTIHEPKAGEVVLMSYEDASRRLMPREGCRAASPIRCVGGVRDLRVALPERCATSAGSPWDEPCGSFGLVGIPDHVETFGSFYVRIGKGTGAQMDVYNAWNAARLFLPCGPIPIAVPESSHLVADEAHFLKNKRSLRAGAYRKLEERARSAWLLTGTPLPNSPPELWAVLDSAGLANVAFGSWPEFVELFGGQFVEVPVRGGGWKKKRKVVQWPKDESATLHQQIFERARPLLASVMLRRKKSEVLPDLPPKIYQQIEVELAADIGRDCEKAQAHLAARGIDLTTLEDTETIPIGEISPLRMKLATAKTPFAEEICEEYEDAGVPLIVFSAHVHPVQTIGSRKGWAFIDGTITDRKRQKIVSDFQGGKLRGVAASIRAAGTALTLTRASNELFVDLDWVPANNEQASDRCHRIGQTNSVLIRTLVSSHPMDARVTEVLAYKSKLIAAAIG
jgi:hypothetical protein